MDELQLAYFAGLFDGEGHVGLHLRSVDNGIDTTLVITNTHRNVFLPLLPEFGGAIKTRQKTASHHRQVYHWQACGMNAERFARAIRPYSIIKAEEIDFYLSFCQQFLRRHLHRLLTDEELEEREKQVSSFLKLREQDGIPTT
jgi:hypothetical protein